MLLSKRAWATLLKSQPPNVQAPYCADAWPAKSTAAQSARSAAPRGAGLRGGESEASMTGSQAFKVLLNLLLQRIAAALAGLAGWRCCGLRCKAAASWSGYSYAAAGWSRGGR